MPVFALGGTGDEVVENLVVYGLEEEDTEDNEGLMDFKSTITK